MIKNWLFTLQNGDTFKQDELNYPDLLLISYNQVSIESELSKYTSRPGGVEVGKRRESVGTIKLEYSSHDINDGTIDDINLLYKACKYTESLTNSNGSTMTLVPTTPSTKSPVGSREKVVTFSCTFKSLKPYWEAETLTDTQTISSASVNRFAITVNGTVSVNPTVKFTPDNGQSLTSLLVTNTGNNQSIQLLGMSLTGDGSKVLTIDSENGTVDFDGTDLIAFLNPGSGFLELEPFTNSFEVSSSADGELNTEYKEGLYFG